MLARGQGKIVFTASMLSFQGGLLVTPYAASKSGVAGLARAFINEWASREKSVYGLALGYVATNLTEALRADSVRSEEILERIPEGHLVPPSDFGGPLVFICSQAANYIHGAILTVDGGWLAR